MLNLIVYSKDRPMQLQATLDSIEINTRGLFNKIDVVYLATDSEYQKGYDMLAKRKPFVGFVKQTDFKKNILDLMTEKYVCMAADDDLFFRPIGKDWKDQMTDDVFAFSFRLGLNIDWCYPLNRGNKLEPEYSTNGDLIKWAWEEKEFDFAYPLSVISHIYRTDEIRAFTEKCQFVNPNQYESALQKYLPEIERPNMVAYKHSRVFGVPANRVNDTHPNRSGLTHSYTTKQLNDLYLAGNVIDVPLLDFSNIHAAQQEIEYVFRKI